MLGIKLNHVSKREPHCLLQICKLLLHLSSQYKKKYLTKLLTPRNSEIKSYFSVFIMNHPTKNVNKIESRNTLLMITNNLHIQQR